jgi:hypothetical protein
MLFMRFLQDGRDWRMPISKARASIRWLRIPF